MPDLVELVEAGEVHVTWEELEKIQQYTINFNPAIEIEWSMGQEEPRTKGE